MSIAVQEGSKILGKREMLGLKKKAGHRICGENRPRGEKNKRGPSEKRKSVHKKKSVRLTGQRAAPSLEARNRAIKGEGEEGQKIHGVGERVRRQSQEVKWPTKERGPERGETIFPGKKDLQRGGEP